MTDASCGEVGGGGRVVVPPRGGKSVFIELHGGHPGTSWYITNEAARTRSGVTWPGMDQEIENMVSVPTVNKVDHLLPRHRYIHGVGRPDPGHGYMWTLQVQWKGRCF